MVSYVNITVYFSDNDACSTGVLTNAICTEMLEICCLFGRVPLLGKCSCRYSATKPGAALIKEKYLNTLVTKQLHWKNSMPGSPYQEQYWSTHNFAVGDMPGQDPLLRQHRP